MSDKSRNGRKSDDRDVVRKSVVRENVRKAALANHTYWVETGTTDKLGREQQRRATAYGRARGQI